MPPPSPDWLLVVDMQPAFGRSDSPWYVPQYQTCARNVARLVDTFGNRVLFTRFVPPETPKGAWQSYYEIHRFAMEPRNHMLWELDPRWGNRRSVSSPRFAKWLEAAPLIPQKSDIVMCGVATDCCVLGTAIEANDFGRKVRLVVDACAAASANLHEAALTILSDRAGLLNFSIHGLEQTHRLSVGFALA